MEYILQYMSTHSGIKTLCLTQIISLTLYKDYYSLSPSSVWGYWSEMRNNPKVCLGRKFIYEY